LSTTRPVRHFQRLLTRLGLRSPTVARSRFPRCVIARFEPVVSVFALNAAEPLGHRLRRRGRLRDVRSSSTALPDASSYYENKTKAFGLFQVRLSPNTALTSPDPRRPRPHRPEDQPVKHATDGLRLSMCLRPPLSFRPASLFSRIPVLSLLCMALFTTFARFSCEDRLRVERRRS